MTLNPEQFAANVSFTAEARSLLRELLAAYTSGALNMESQDVGDPMNGIPLHPWHEEWIAGVREALGEKGDE